MKKCYIKEIKYGTQFYTVSTFVIPFYYGSGSAKAKRYGSYGSGTLELTRLGNQQKKQERKETQKA
jgi:hypothetical protein